MAEDAKRPADKDAEPKSGHEIKQEEVVKEEKVDQLADGAKVEAKSDDAEKQVDEKDSDSEEKKSKSENAESQSDENHTELAKDESESDDLPQIEAKVITNQEVEAKVESDEAEEGIPKVTLTVEKVEEADKSSDDEAKSDDIEIEIALKQKDERKSEEFQQSVREQIENCKFEIISSVQDSVHSELQGSIKEFKKQERRRRVGFILRDIIILILAAMLGYTIYCLYDAQYFDFMKPQCEREGTCAVQKESESNDDVAQAPEVVKDTKWYVENYGYLYNALQLNLNADKVSAYYLYSGDYRLNEIQPNYLLGMAYNVLNSSTTYDSANGIVIPSVDLRAAFANLFGTTDYFAKEDFTNGCVDFEYDKASDSFITPAVQCVTHSNREIAEEIIEAYEEGNAIYFITTAAIYDKTENAFYNFDNLFRPVVQNVDKASLTKHQAVLNQYQYRFKKVDNKFYFSDIVKLK